MKGEYLITESKKPLDTAISKGKIKNVDNSTIRMLILSCSRKNEKEQINE